jgi:hypothetical protein
VNKSHVDDCPVRANHTYPASEHGFAVLTCIL